MANRFWIIRIPENGMLVNGTPIQELVRCKDCEHYHKGFNCDLMQKPITKDGDYFCADGRRRELE